MFDVFGWYQKSHLMFEEKTRDNYISWSQKGDGSLADREYIQIYLRSTNEQTVYKREGYDVLTYMGDLGGLLDILVFTGKLLTLFITAKLFHAALIGRAYRV
mmetsp:Transcript_13889/g.16554  ORF Transcript_13889/g.16554 Transcript_13889/m.16554 type:complete len:102 (-) Transcript_13889:112-417(-)